MKRLKTSLCPARLVPFLLAAVIAAMALPFFLSGCGEKIAIPEAEGLWASLDYREVELIDEPGVRQVAVGWNNLFILNDFALLKRELPEYDVPELVATFSDPTALCVDETGHLVFVWDQGTGQVKIFNSTTFVSHGEAFLPDVMSVTSMVTSSAGMDTTIIGGRTFLYLSDPVAGLIHRYAVMGATDSEFTCSDCLLPVGVLAWPEGGGARAGLRYAG